MKDKNYVMRPHVVFMSCEPDRERSLEHDLRMQGLRWKVGVGQYQGEREKSYMVILSDNITLATRRLRTIEQLATRYQQESILYCDNEHTAYLLYTDGRPDAPKLGKLVSVALPLGDYSYFDGCYFEVQA